MIINLLAPKGGQGLTVTSARLALGLAKRQHKTVLRHDGWDMSSIFGVADEEMEIISNLHLIKDPYRGSSDYFVQEATVPIGNTFNIVVIQPCYLALRRFQRSNEQPHIDGAIVMSMPERALSTKDVLTCLGLPLVGELSWDPRVARSVDSGLLTRFDDREMQVLVDNLIHMVKGEKSA